MKVELEDGAGIVHMMLTVTGTQGTDSCADLANQVPNPKEREEIVRKYVSTRSQQGHDEPGKVTAKLYAVLPYNLRHYRRFLLPR